jgi:hypothetical protein
MRTEQRGRMAWGYWSLVAALIGFGLLALFSIGLPFLVTGLALVILRPVRHRPASFWPVLIAVWAFFLGYLLVAPLGCTSSIAPAQSHTTCSSLLGHYSGGDGYNPALWPAVAAGVLMAICGWALSRRFLKARRPDRTQRPAPRA